MTKFKEECTTTKTDSEICLSENKRRFRIINENNTSISITTIDNCEICNGIRADFALKYNEKICVVELKGKNTGHALNQIAATFRYIKRKNIPHSTLEGFVVSSRVPPAANTRNQIQISKMKKEFDAKSIIKNGEITYKI